MLANAGFFPTVLGPHRSKFGIVADMQCIPRLHHDNRAFDLLRVIRQHSHDVLARRWSPVTTLTERPSLYLCTYTNVAYAQDGQAIILRVESPPWRVKTQIET